MAKRPRIHPKQSKISVQDVPDFSTPAGRAMENEEMRRLALGVNEGLDELSQRIGGLAGDVAQIQTQSGGPPAQTPQQLLQVWNRTNAGSPDIEIRDVLILDFDDNNQQATGIAVNFELVEVQPGQARLRGYVPDFTVGVVHATTQYDKVRWLEFRDSPTVQFDVDQTSPGYVRIEALSLLTIMQDGDAVGDNETVVLDFDNDTLSKPIDYTGRIWFDVIDDGSGVRRVLAWFDPGTGSGTMSSWTFSDGLNTTLIEDGNTLVVTGVNGVSVAVTGSDTVEIGREFYLRDDGVTVGAGDTYLLNFDSQGETSTSVVVNFEVDDDGFGQRTVRAWVASTSNLTIRQDGVDVGGSDTTVIDFDNDTFLKPIDYTDRVWFEVFDDGSGIRRVLAWFAPGTGGGTMSSWTFSDGLNTTLIEDGNTLTVTGIEYVSVTVVGPDAVEIGRAFYVADDGVAVGPSDTYTLNFDSQGSTATDVAVNFEVINDGFGQRTVRAWVESTSSLTLRQDGVDVGGSDTTVIDFDNDTFSKPVDYTDRVWFELFDDGSGVRRVLAWFVAGDGSMSKWRVGVNAESPGEDVDDDELVDFSGPDGTVVWTRTGLNLEARSPLQLQQDGVDIGPDDTVVIDYDNATISKPVSYTDRIWFELFDDGTGVRRILGWFDASGDGAMSKWRIGVNAESPGEDVDDNELVDFSGPDGTVVWTRTGLNLEARSPLQLQQDGVDIGPDDTVVVDFDNATVGKPVTFTDRVWFEVIDDGTGTRRVVAWVEDESGGSFGFNVAAQDTAGVGAVINGATITLTHGLGLLITRSGDDIHIEIDTTDPPWGDLADKRVKTGIITFPTAVADYVSGADAYRYGKRARQDIVHNWNLSNMNNFHLELVDLNIDQDDEVTVINYRSGLNAMNGQDFGNVRFINRPFWTAVDRNTITVYATMSRGEPTDMQFRYVLEEK